MNSTLAILLVDDDKDVLDLLQDGLDKTLDGFDLYWHPCNSFREAETLLNAVRFDLVATDIYEDRGEKAVEQNHKARNLLDVVREKRFCPVVVFSDASKPDDPIYDDPFVRFVDKAAGDAALVGAIRELLKTNVPTVARQLHEDLDSMGAQYLWTFLSKHWDSIREEFGEHEALDRLVRRRAAVQLGRLDQESGTERETVHPSEYYLYPPVASSHRFGEIIKHKENANVYRFILTPHCHLVVQPNHGRPRADHVLTALATPLDSNAVKRLGTPNNHPDAQPDREKIRRALSIRSEFGSPRGRYCILPPFLDLPPLQCDWMQLESVAIDELNDQFSVVAVLDSPFAESAQAAFNAFYANVGIPNLDLERVLKTLNIE